MKPIVTCKNCGIDFAIKASRIKESGNCCSMKCASEQRIKVRALNVTCWSCGKKFYMSEAHIKDHVHPDRICCSIDCARDEKSDRMSGAGNHQHGLKGELNDSFKSDIHITNYGYIKCRCLTHPLADVGGHVLFHRLVFEEYLRDSHQFDELIELEGQFVLPRDLFVHHRDENKLNNVVSNLETISLEEHTSLHTREVIDEKARDERGRFAKEGGLISGKLSKSHKLDAGQDIFASENVLIPPKSSALIHTDLKIAVPEGCVGLLWSKSGLSVKHNLEVGAGCIDAGYTGEVLVHLYNHGDENYEVKSGMKIVQLLTIPLNLNPYANQESFEDSTRGAGGFGSTGKS